MIKNIIFDFGGVIIRHKTNVMIGIVSETFSISSEKASEIWYREITSLMTGQTSSKQYLKKVKKEVSSDKSPQELMRLWKELYIKEANDVDWKLLEFIEKLKKNYRVYLLTDTFDIHDEYNNDRGIYEKFTKVFRSHKEGISKISDEAFLRVLRNIGAKPEECIFIDDLKSNVDRAYNLGIHSFLYTNRQELETYISRHLM